jgi:hypothetical protein
VVADRTESAEAANCFRFGAQGQTHEQFVITQWSPAIIVALITAIVAAIPVPKHTAPSAPSKAATLFSNAVTVGFVVRE